MAYQAAIASIGGKLDGRVQIADKVLFRKPDVIGVQFYQDGMPAVL